MFIRFALSDRLSHWVLAIVFVLLAITGFSQMFPNNPISLWAFDAFRGIENVRLLHHELGFVFFIFIIYMIGTIVYATYIRNIRLNGLPNSKDVGNILKSFKYNFNQSDEVPQVGRITLAMKAIFWGLSWGSVIMLVSGFMLLNPIAVTTLFPGLLIPIAKAAHGYEAILITLALGVWHLYFYLMKQIDAMVKNVRPDIRAEHPIEYPLEAVDYYDNRPKTQVDIRLLERFWRYKLPLYLLISGIVILGAVYFINFEQTSILTIMNPEDVTTYSPDRNLMYSRLTTEDPSEIVAQAQDPTHVISMHSWKSGIGILLLTNCVVCHESLGVEGANLRDYNDIIDSGLVVPNEPDSSGLLSAMSDENHIDRYSVKLFDSVYDWVAAGALEVNIAPSREHLYSNLNWIRDIKPIMNARCTECHGASAFHDLDFRSYYSTMDSGAIMLSSPDESPIFIKIGEGGHPGQFTTDEILKVHEWVGYGAQSGMSHQDAATEYREVMLSGIQAVEAGEVTTPEEIVAVLATLDFSVSEIFESQCTMCHDSKAMGDVDLSSYDSAMESNSIVPGDPGASSLVTLMQSGSHPAVIEGDRLDLIIEWIESGAPETTADQPVSAQPAESGETAAPAESAGGMEAMWDSSIGAIFSSCTMCHGAAAVGGVDLSSYAAAMDSGSIVPGNPGGSSLVTLMESGIHSGLLSDEDLQTVKDWISGG